MKYWLMKSEPDVFSIDHLAKKQKSIWDGVRNYQARNFMRDEMKLGDTILFYHSSCEIPGIAGLATVSKESHPDPTQFDKNSVYYDEKATKENPRWFLVEVTFKEKFSSIFTLAEIKADKKLSHLPLVQKGSRLSIHPVEKKDFDYIMSFVK